MATVISPSELETTVLRECQVAPKRIPRKYQEHCNHCDTLIDTRTAYRSTRTGSYYCDVKCLNLYTDN